MANKLIFLPLIVLSLLIISFESYANVIVDDADSETQVIAVAGFMSADVPTGSGLVGDYQLIACGVSTDNGNTFSDPSQGTWTLLDTGACGVNGFAPTEYGADLPIIQRLKISRATGHFPLLYLPPGLLDTTK